jgi:hypothetical protein
MSRGGLPRKVGGACDSAGVPFHAGYEKYERGPLTMKLIKNSEKTQEINVAKISWVGYSYNLKEENKQARATYE